MACEKIIFNGAVKINTNGQVFKKSHGNWKEVCIGESQVYKVVTVNGKRYAVHRLIAKEFVENPYNKPCVNHIDGNKHNNAASNLEWATQSENIAHAYRIGIMKRKYPECIALPIEKLEVISKEYGIPMSRFFDDQETRLSNRRLTSNKAQKSTS